MLLIGVTGGIACGKTEVCRVFQKKGAIILSGDEIGKEVVQKNRKIRKKLVQTFGETILDKNKSLNRRKLGRLAFTSKESKDKLNKIIHPDLLKDLKKRIRSLRAKRCQGLVVVDAALIVEWGLQDGFDHLIFVQSKRGDKIKRLQKHKGYSRKEALDRIKSQLPEIKKKRLADFVIVNDKGVHELRRKAEKVFSRIISTPPARATRSS
jgi:dephospho-CoA kinase